MDNIKDIEKYFWKAIERIRGGIEPTNYQYKILGLIFLRYLSDRFDEIYKKLSLASDQGANPEDPDEYIALGALYLPEKTRWSFFKKNITNPEIGFIIDKAMIEIQNLKSDWRGCLPDGYGAPDINPRQISELIEIISTINAVGNSSDIWIDLFEFVLSIFPEERGKSTGEFYSPQSIVELTIKTLAPEKGRIYDPCCGSGGMFTEVNRYMHTNHGDINRVSFYGQEQNPNTVKLTTMNLAMQDIDAIIGTGNIFENDNFPELKADYIVANPPFNCSWNPENLWNDKRWIYGIPPARNANYAWLQHCLSKLSPEGTTAVILPNGSLNSGSGSESEIRRRMIENGNIECIAALPSNLFFNTSIPVSLWILSKNNRKKEILFINAAKLGEMATRRIRKLTPDDISLISHTYQTWKNEDNNYKDVNGFCKSISVDEVIANSCSLLPSIYVDIEEEDKDTISFDEKMNHLTQKLSEQFARNNELEKNIRQELKQLGYEL